MHGYNFTVRIRMALAMAREEAVRWHHDSVGPEHVLLGLIRLGEGNGYTALRNMKIDVAEIRRAVEHKLAKGKSSASTGPDIPYTSRAKKVLELAMWEARELNHSYVGTEHLLLGILGEKKSLAAQALTDAGVTLSAARAEVVRPEKKAIAAEVRTDAGVNLSAAEIDFVRLMKSEGSSAGPETRSPNNPQFWLYGSGPFSRRLTAVLSALSADAARYGREDFTPEDLLLELLRAGGAARTVIELMGVDPEHVARTLAPFSRAATSTDSIPCDEPQIGPDAPIVQIFAHANTDERHLTNSAIGTDHILLGILATYRGPAYQALAANGIGYDQTLAVVQRISG